MLSKIFNLRLWSWLIAVGFLTSTIMVIGISYIVWPKLPSIDNLHDVQFQVPLRIYSRDEKLIAEYGEQKRTPINIDESPKLLINSVLSAEDDRFYEHPGVDFKGMLRAVVHLLKTGQKGQGGSTITMQVARNFFLSREKTYLRKLNEILLSLKIENKLSKNEILELYLNKIYLGNRSYGFAAASKVYYGKPIEELRPAQMAMLAGLPKAPSRYNPVINRKRAIQRRNYVLGRMNKLGYLQYDEYQAGLKFIDDSRLHGLNEEVSAPYIAEMVRAEMVKRFKNEAYTSGYKVYTSVNSRLQIAANNALRTALLDYDERHGYRQSESHVELAGDSLEEDWAEILAEYSESTELWPALVIEVGEKDAIIFQPTYGKQILRWDNMSWASKWIGDGKAPGKKPEFASEIVKRGDIIRVRQVKDNQWRLTQMPTVEGALVSLSPDDGSLIALVGGFNFSNSKFNRVLQAERQPGSNLKPFNYSAALEKGFTAASLINDAPVVFEDAGLESTWRPENYSGKVFGPTRLRKALLKSRNLVSIRLLRAVGISYAIDYLTRFGFTKNKLPRDLSLALGSAAIKPIELATAYSVFANDGYKIEPYFIDRIETEEGEVVYTADPAIVCPECEEQQKLNQANDPTVMQVNNSAINGVTSKHGAFDGAQIGEVKIEMLDEQLVQQNSSPNGDNINGEMVNGIRAPKQKKIAPRVVTAQNVYIMSTIMRDVIQHGTGRRAKALGRNDIAGKTGTTNDQRDAWFSGFSPDVVTTAWVGFDTPKPLGDNETGGRAALPMWISFMREALKGVPERHHERPPGLVNVRIDPETGLLLGPGQRGGQFEVFRVGNVPKSSSDSSPVNNDPTVPDSSDPSNDDVQDQLF